MQHGCEANPAPVRTVRLHRLAGAVRAHRVHGDAAVTHRALRNAAGLIELAAGRALVADALQEAADPGGATVARPAVGNAAARLPFDATERPHALAHHAVVLRTGAAVVARATGRSAARVTRIAARLALA